MSAPFTFLRRDLGADHGDVDRICLELRGVLGGLPERERFALELLAREALSNAVRHGCRGQGRIAFTCRLGRSRAVLTVQDDGPGFDWRAALTAPPDDDASHGRGLTLYGIYASRFHFNPCGNRLLLIRTLPEPTMSEPQATPDPTHPVLHPGDLTSATVEQARDRLKALLQGGARSLTIDLAGVQMVDSMGIGLLIQANNSLAKLGGGLVVRNASAELTDLFRSMRLDKRFTLQD